MSFKKQSTIIFLSFFLEFINVDSDNKSIIIINKIVWFYISSKAGDIRACDADFTQSLHDGTSGELGNTATCLIEHGTSSTSCR